MKDQHTLIKGYRDFDQSTVDVINEIKSAGNELKALIEKVQGEVPVDPRWVAIATTDLQKGFMALVRAVAQPEGF